MNAIAFDRYALARACTSPTARPMAVLVEGERWATPLSALGEFPDDMPALLDGWDDLEPRLHAAWQAGRGRAARRALEGLRLLAPVQPRQVLCAGANYRQHVIDLVAAQGAGAATEGMSVEERRADAARRIDARARDGQPYAFPKLAGCLIGPNDDIVVPRDATQLDWELELAAVIGRTAWRVPREQALGCVAGYTVVNDLTRRELVYRADMKTMGTDWLRAKSGPGFMPTGPWLVPGRFVPDPQALSLHLSLNGQVMQQARSDDMLFGVARLIEYLSAHVRLLPGDLIATGSPSGNGMHHGRFLQPGDVIEAGIEGLGMQRNRCVAEGER